MIGALVLLLTLLVLALSTIVVGDAECRRRCRRGEIDEEGPIAVLGEPTDGGGVVTVAVNAETEVLEANNAKRWKTRIAMERFIFDLAFPDMMMYYILQL